LPRSYKEFMSKVLLGHYSCGIVVFEALCALKREARRVGRAFGRCLDSHQGTNSQTYCSTYALACL